ncbi:MULTISPECIES: class I SAM-dependent methyltransferase [Prochlorococcus]|uniref:class I SAM-dependent methyltransferase n=1 Tax=Prochlorococcus TaxID=1218 RepID=UPI00053385EE|nr:MULTISPECIES: class I SAM-dependent methyltransferase [Prochlorococcus]KGG14177.1 hypothetical protein EV05_0066 [Prochlorococcus sp. MIT 0601]
MDPNKKKLVKRYNKYLSGITWLNNNCLCGNSTGINLFKKDRYGIKNPVCLCLECGIIRANPIPPSAEMDNFYSSDLYRQIYDDEDLENYFDRKVELALSKPSIIFDALNPLVKFKDKKSILEIGCAGGWNLLQFKNNGYTDIVGFEPGKYYREMGAKKLGLDIRYGFLEEALKEGKKYDIIILNHVIEHILNPLEVLNKISRLLEEKGILYLGVPNIQRYDIGQIQNAHYWYFSPLNFAKLITTAQYKIIDFGDDSIHMYFVVEKNNLLENSIKEWIKPDFILKQERNQLIFKAMIQPIKKYLIALKKLLSIEFKI